MALRQVVDDLMVYPGLYLAKDPRSAPLPSKPVVAGFRAEGDMGEVIGALERVDFVKVDAAAGAGKSTKLPALLARHFDLPVYHVVPSGYLARDLYSYLASRGGAVSLVETVGSVASASGVNIIPAHVLVGKWLKAGKLEMSPSIIFHDESHEADAYTYFISQVWTAVEGVIKYVSATATHEPAGFRPVELPSVVVEKRNPACADSSKWDVLAVNGDPWEVAEISNHLLVFEDNRAKALRLVAEYNKAGAQAFRLHNRMEKAGFDAAMKTLRFLRRGMVVLVADSSFRSGFTWPIGCVIDTGRVSCVVAGQAGPEIYTRVAFEFEMYQAAARVARTAGCPAVTWAPPLEYPRKLSVLEPSEVDAAALLFRLFNKLAPRDLRASVMLSGKVPREIIAALRGEMPLACMHESQLVDMVSLVSEEGRSSPTLRHEYQNLPRRIDSSRIGTSADVGIAHEQAEMRERARRDSGVSFGSAPVGRAPKREYDEASSSTMSAGQASDPLSELASGLAGIDLRAVESFQPGCYYMSPNLVGVPLRGPTLPDGYASVMRLFADDPTGVKHLGLPLEVRAVAVAALVNRFTLCSIQLNALATVAPDAGALGQQRSKLHMRDWLHRYMEQLGSLQAECDVVGRTMGRLARGMFSFEQYDPAIMQPEVDQMVDLILGEVRRGSTEGGDRESGFASVKSEFGGTLVEYPKRPPALGLPQALLSYGAKVKPKPGGYTGRVPTYARWVTGASYNPGVAKEWHRLEGDPPRKRA